MPKRVSAKTGSELFIVDNSDEEWKVLRYLHDWCGISKGIDIATGYFEIGSLRALDGEWQKVDKIRILMGDEVSHSTKAAFIKAYERLRGKLDESLEEEKLRSDFLTGVPAIVDGIESGKIECRVYRKDKFHAKAYITHGRLEVVGSSALVGSSNFTYPGLTENIELNVQITGTQVAVLQEWYEQHWDDAEDVTPDILRTIERHVREYSPFDVYAKSLQEFFRGHELTAGEWERNHSQVYKILDHYQREGYQALLKIASRYDGALLCDGVGLGKTFVGLMLIERLILHEKKNVALFVPKAANEPVWRAAIKKHLPHIDSAAFKQLVVLNHTDLQRESCQDALESVKDRAHAIVIDEAHHFRNPGHKGADFKPGQIRGEGVVNPSRYRRLYDLIEGTERTKQVFMLTATPVNNRLLDLQHMIELFSRNKPDHFKSIGIHSLPGHFRSMEKQLEQELVQKGRGDDSVATDLVEAEDVLKRDALFQEIVVQRSRAYVRESQLKHGITAALFPKRDDPQVAEYNLQRTYGRLLEKFAEAFNKDKPLFALAIYNPAGYHPDQEQMDQFVVNRQKQIVGLVKTGFLKRFESSAYAFERSCERLLKKLLAFAQKYSESAGDKRRLETWRIRNKELINYVHEHQRLLFPDVDADDDIDLDEDFITEEMLEQVIDVDPEEVDVSEMLKDTLQDLDQIAVFLNELSQFKPKHDDKLQKLISLLRKDLRQQKVLIFSEFAETARYLKQQLVEAGVDGVEQIDSGIGKNRWEIIRRFAPYYNGSSSGELEDDDVEEIRVLVSTDVLSEGLNLQDATCLINYDLHWNPVRLMQRIGRVDRRMNLDIEEEMVSDHPMRKADRGRVRFWNFLPPDELNSLFTLYKRVAHKTLRISKTFGVPGGKLLTPDDPYEDVRDFIRELDGETSPLEGMSLELQQLLKDDPELAARLDALPGRVFSGKRHVSPGTRGVFFCYRVLRPDHAAKSASGDVPWTEEAGETCWLLYDVVSERIASEPTEIIEVIRCPQTAPRVCELEQKTLSEIRTKVERHVKQTRLRQLNAPQGIKPILRAWMELN